MNESGKFWNGNKKILFFGASNGGKRAYRCRDRSHRVLAFADNDASKHGKTLCGKPIITPDEIASYPYDLIYISCESCFQVYLQLSSMGIDAKKIRTVDQEILRGAFELSKAQGLLLLLAVYGLGHLIYDLSATIFRIIPL